MFGFFNVATAFCEARPIVHTYVPKFKIESTLELTEHLKKAGLQDMFDETAALIGLLLQFHV